MPTACSTVSAIHWPTGPPRFDRPSGENENSDSARKSASAPPVMASASRRMWPGAGAADRPLLAMSVALARRARHRAGGVGRGLRADRDQPPTERLLDGSGRGFAHVDGTGLGLARSERRSPRGNHPPHLIDPTRPPCCEP